MLYELRISLELISCTKKCDDFLSIFLVKLFFNIKSFLLKFDAICSVGFFVDLVDLKS